MLLSLMIFSGMSHTQQSFPRNYQEPKLLEAMVSVAAFSVDVYSRRKVVLCLIPSR